MGKRSRGVTILAWVTLLGSSVVFCIQVLAFAILILVRMNAEEPWAQPLRTPGIMGLGPVQILSSLVAVAISLGFGIGSVGVLRLRAWGRRLFVWSAGLAIPSGFVGALFGAQERAAVLAAGNPAFPTPVVVAIGMVFYLPFLVAYGVLLWFFNRASVRAQFLPAPSGPGGGGGGR